jgi:hypothetical protein
MDVGGGIHLAFGATHTLTNVTVNGNSAGSGAGGIHLQGASTLDMTNVTVTGNQSAATAALVVTGGAVATVVNSTISGNSGSGSYAAVSVWAPSSFKNTIISSNTPQNCAPGGAISWTSLGYNIDSGTTCSFGAAGDQQRALPFQREARLDAGGKPFADLIEAGRYEPPAHERCVLLLERDQRLQIQAVRFPVVELEHGGAHCAAGARRSSIEAREANSVRPFAQVCRVAGRSKIRRSHSMMCGVFSSLQTAG